MSEVEIKIGGRPFTVACKPGEEEFLEAAAKLLDIEASSLVEQLGRMPETQMLLMSALMLADKTAALDDKVRAVQSGSGGKVGKTATAAVPDDLAERLGKIADQAETAAKALEAKAKAAG